MVERWGIGGIRVKFAPAAWSFLSSSFTPRLMPRNGGAITTAVRPAVARITGTSSNSATGLNAHRSVTGRVGVRWEGGNEVRMGLDARIPRGGRYDGTSMNAPLRLALVVGVLGSSMTAALAADAQPTLPPVDVVKVEGALDRPLLGFVNGMLDDASTRGATVVLEVDSAGGIGQDGVGLADRIAQMSVPVIVWVGPVPARASGAAMLLMLASSLSAVAPGSQTGPLQPVDLLHPDTPVPGLDALIDGWLQARGRTAERAHENEALDAAQ